MPLSLDLFATFSKIGLFTFGGGYAMISMIEHHCVEQKKWITHDEMMNIAVIAESTPGPIAINCATYVGYKQMGLLGAIIATLGIITPSFIIIYAISTFLENFMHLAFIANAFKGIKLAVGVLILDAGITMVQKMPKKPRPRKIMICSFIAMSIISLFSLPVSSITLMILAGLISLLLSLKTKQKEGAKQ